MYIRHGISVGEVLRASLWPAAAAACWSAAVVVLHHILGVRVMVLPALPVTTLGIAVSLYLGFKTTSAYNRWWEARQIWGAIVNDSRGWAMHALTLIDNDGSAAQRADIERLVRRHLAWVKALAFQLRSRSKLREGRRQALFDRRLPDGAHLSTGTRENYERYLDADEAEALRRYANAATHIIRRQGDALRALFDTGRLHEMRFVEMTRVLDRLYVSQGQCERIKNTQFPWAITLFGRISAWVYIVLLPIAFIDTFDAELQRLFEDGPPPTYMLFVMVPFTTLISWFFYTMEKVSESCEDPFEGGTSDVPVSALSRTIEIDLLQMIDADEVPPPAAPVDGVLY